MVRGPEALLRNPGSNQLRWLVNRRFQSINLIDGLLPTADLVAPRFEPEVTWCEAQLLPLCYAVSPKVAMVAMDPSS